MISFDELSALTQLIASASKPPVTIAKMDFRGTRYDVQTLNPGGLKIGMTLDLPVDQSAQAPGTIVTLLARPNAEFVAAAYEWMPRLIARIEELERENATLMEQATAPA